MRFESRPIPTESGEVEGTELVFSEHEEGAKDQVYRAVLFSSNAYDEELFPDRIVLEGLWDRQRLGLLLEGPTCLPTVSPTGRALSGVRHRRVERVLTNDYL